MKFVNDPRCNSFVPKVKKVTIHSPRPYRLKELAESMSSQTDISDPSLQAYIYMRKTLIDSLNALPSLKVVTVTDLPFRGIVNPPARWNHDTLFDPLITTLTTRQKPGVFAQDQVEQMEDVRRAMEHAEVSSLEPQVYGLEAALSIFYDLTARDSIQISLVTNLSGQGFPLMGLGQLDLLISVARFTAHGHYHSNYEQMFGLEDLQASIIYEQCQLHLIVVGDPRACAEGVPPGLVGIHAMIAEVPTALRSLTIKGIPENELSQTLVSFFTERLGGAAIQQSLLRTQCSQSGQLISSKRIATC